CSDMRAASNCLFCDASDAPRGLHSFPTRRSSDLGFGQPAGELADRTVQLLGPDRPVDPSHRLRLPGRKARRLDQVAQGARLALRSEEHTSELQSPYDLVYRLLLLSKHTSSYGKNR